MKFETIFSKYLVKRERRVVTYWNEQKNINNCYNSYSKSIMPKLKLHEKYVKSTKRLEYLIWIMGQIVYSKFQFDNSIILIFMSNF